MTIPSFQVQKDLGKIRQELESTGAADNYDNGPYTSNATSLKGTFDATYDAINTNSTYSPNSTAPHGINEWNAYDHNATAGTVLCTELYEQGKLAEDAYKRDKEMQRSILHSTRIRSF